VVNDFGGKRMVADPENYRLVSTSQHTVVVHHYEAISSKDQEELIGVIQKNIGYYLDQVIQMSDGDIEIRKSSKQILRDMEGIVAFHIKLYDYKVDAEFRGFSAELQNKLKNIELLNWDSTSNTDGNSRFNSQQMAFNYLKSQLNDIALLSESELNDYALAHVHEFKKAGPLNPNIQLADIDTSEFKRNTLLPGEDHRIENIYVEDAMLIPMPDAALTEIPRGTDPELMALLKSNNELIRFFGDQMLLMQRELVDIKKEGQAYQQEFLSIRTELKDLQVAIDDLRDANQNGLNTGVVRPARGGVAEVIRFEKNSNEISLADQLRLNDIYYQLMTNAGQKVMITGFADRSGNTELNAAISRSRALAVKNYLRSKGIPSDRLVINFLGDTYSDSENSADRKVEIAWLNP
jgi:outer membrane protein OmpA-like peptidoglycan-associated protein